MISKHWTGKFFRVRVILWTSRLTYNLEETTGEQEIDEKGLMSALVSIRPSPPSKEPLNMITESTFSRICTQTSEH